MSTLDLTSRLSSTRVCSSLSADSKDCTSAARRLSIGTAFGTILRDALSFSCTDGRPVRCLRGSLTDFPPATTDSACSTNHPTRRFACLAFQRQSDGPLVSEPERAVLELLSDVGGSASAPGGARFSRRSTVAESGCFTRAAGAMQAGQDRSALSDPRSGVSPALGREARSRAPSDRQRQALGGSLERRSVGTQAMNSTYLATARLLVEVAPLVFEGGDFALKGGYGDQLVSAGDAAPLDRSRSGLHESPDAPGPEALAAINEGLRASRDRLLNRGFNVQAMSASEMGGRPNCSCATTTSPVENRGQHRDSRHDPSNSDRVVDADGKRRTDG